MHFNKLPIVLVDRCFSGFAIPSVSTNNFEAAGALTKYLFDKGHEHIGFICSPQANTSSIQERIEGFTSTHIVNNRSVNDSNILNTIISPHSANDPTAFRKDVDTIKSYLEKNKNITALISTEFTVTQIIMQAVQEIGKNIPEDYSLVMFDGYESVTSPLVTHIRQDQEKIGQLAVETLLAKISDKIVGQKIYVPSNIIEGNTVKDLNCRKK